MIDQYISFFSFAATRFQCVLEYFKGNTFLVIRQGAVLAASPLVLRRREELDLPSLPKFDQTEIKKIVKALSLLATLEESE